MTSLATHSGLAVSAAAGALDLVLFAASAAQTILDGDNSVVCPHPANLRAPAEDRAICLSACVPKLPISGSGVHLASKSLFIERGL